MSNHQITKSLNHQRPKHIAIIMDGNGRWAQARGLPRTMGHKQGVEAVKRAVRSAGELGVEYLTLFGFSSENWNRPAEEVGELMRLLRMYLRSETAELHRNNIRLRVVGNRTQLAPDIVELIENAEALTADNTKITVVIALNYGGRNDILEAASAWAMDCAAKGRVPDFADAEEHLPSYLMTDGIPDPDILIRTSGEMRISNFLLWQSAYAELIFSPVLWPDFQKEDMEAAISEYSQRDRRFGAVKTAGGDA
ncbi:MAG: isoprenyl transferase [Rhodospirillales bacterium]|nr:isoprenyl transferase [Rhodospirillales bacterium]MCB9995616.1 isoprenyl transferase [Rhodospirillales bacterium]